MNKILPPVANPARMSTAMCANVFDELEAALELLRIARKDFNPQLRRQGYSYAQCTQFLRENGVDTYPGAIGGVLGTMRG